MSATGKLSRLPCGRVGKWITVVFWVVLFFALGSLSAKLTDAQKNDAAQWLPKSAESTQALELSQRIAPQDSHTALVVYDRSGGPVTSADQAKATADAQRFPALRNVTGGEVESQVVKVDGPTASKDGRALLTTVQIKVGKQGWPALGPVVEDMREVASSAGPGLRVHVTGPAGFSADSSEALTGLDATVLLITVLIVLLILVLTYRSPVLWILPLLGAMVALTVAQAIIYLLADNAGLTVNGFSAFILTVLVFGVGTDYTLLIVARYREELRRQKDRHGAMASALGRVTPALVASAGTVVVSMLILLFADLSPNKSLGPVAAISVATALIVMITLLPALLVVFGRWVFWPARPTYQEGPTHERGLWAKVGAAIAVRPRFTWIATAVVLAVVSLGVLGLKADGLGGADQFRDKTEAAIGQEIHERHFSAGSGSPVQVIGKAGAAPALVTAVTGTSGVAEASRPVVKDGYAYVEATLAARPDTDAAFRTVDALRSAVDSVPGADAVVGGGSAITLDVQRAAAHDNRLVIPLMLVGILLILCLVLRAVVAPLILIGTVLLAFGAALGISAVLFHNVFGFESADTGFPLWAFVFMVALGIDYNIFLATRVREETLLHGPREGALRGLAATGGVITSAGVVVAGVFGGLGTLPLVFMAEIGVAVAVGVLLDTFIVRSVLVTALALDLGRWMWWPGEAFLGPVTARRTDEAGDESASVQV